MTGWSFRFGSSLYPEQRPGEGFSSRLPQIPPHPDSTAAPQAKLGFLCGHTSPLFKSNVHVLLVLRVSTSCGAKLRHTWSSWGNVTPQPQPPQ